MDKRNSLVHNQSISRSLKGRRPWNKGIGLEDPRIRKGIQTRREFAKLRELIKLIYQEVSND